MTSYIKDFYNVFQSEIAPYLMQLESKRKEKLFKLFLLVCGLIFIAIALVYYLHSSYWDLSEQVFARIAIGFIAFFVFAIYFVFKYSFDFKKLLKATCYPKILKSFNIFWDEQNFRISDHLINESGMFESYNRVRVTDSFEGVHCDTKFNMNEIEMLRVSGSGKHKSVVNVFRGVLLSIPNYEIQSRLVVTTKGYNFTTARFGHVISYLIFAIFLVYMAFVDTTFLNENKVLLLSFWAIGLFCFCMIIYKQFIAKPELNKVISSKLVSMNKVSKYDVFCNNSQIADNLLNSKFLRRLDALGKTFGVKNMKCAFCSGQVLLALQTNKNLFEIGSLFSPLTNTAQLKCLFLQLAAILEFIDCVQNEIELTEM